MVDSTPVGPFPALTATAARDWLRKSCRIETTITDLAKQWGWERTRASRTLSQWEKAGQITRAPGLQGKIIICAVEADGPVTSTPTTAVQAVTHPSTRRAPASTLLARALLLVAVALGGIGLVVNAKFAASFGQSGDAAIILAVIGVAVDVLSVILPAAACQLWLGGARLTAVTTWCVWPFLLGMSIFATIGFAATNIGDTLGTRAKMVSEISTLRTSVARLRTERASITEARSVSELQTELERERPFVDRDIWIKTRACHDVTIRGSAAACSTIMGTRQAMSAAERRNVIDAQLGEAEAKLADLPGIPSGDPQAEAASEVLAWLTAARVSPAPHEIARLRVLSLALVPALAGLLLTLAITLIRAADQTL